MNTELCLVGGCGAENSARLGVDPKNIIAVDGSLIILSRYKAVSPVSMIVCADISNLPFADNAMRSVQETHVLEHLDPQRSVGSINEAKRVLTNNGQAIFAVPHPFFDNVLASIDPVHHSKEMHQQVLSGSQLEELVTNSGLEISKVRAQNGKQAMELIVIGILHRLRPDLMTRDEQTGYRSMMSVKTHNKSLIKDMVKGTFRIISCCVSPILDRIIPYENIVVAVKNRN